MVGHLLVSTTDSIMDTWSFTGDDFNCLTSGNRFEDLVSPQPAGNRIQSFTVSPQGGGASAPISVRLAGQDFGAVGQWSDGLHIPYVNGCPSPKFHPGAK
jgi:hypothetical protein